MVGSPPPPGGRAPTEQDLPRTLGRALDEAEAAVFVGREPEIARFRAWLADDEAPAVLNVVGRGGMGKTTLLAAFRREARSGGREVLSVNAENLDDTPESFIEELGPGADPIGFCNEHRCVVLVDAVAKMPWLSSYLQQDFLPKLDAGVKLVIAGRIPLGGTWSRWPGLVERMTLERLAPAAARDYLGRRGIEDRRLVDQIVRATAGLPLALALAADMVADLGVTDLGTVGEWRLVLRGLVERLLREVDDPELIRLIEACATVRHFDEPTLAAITGLEDISGAFARLCGLSFVRAGEHGLRLHDDVRQVVGDDLRWRNPERYASFRDAALGYLRDRMGRASAEERHWLWAERMFLWEDSFVRNALFGPSPSEIVVTLGSPGDADEVTALERRWHDELLPRASAVTWSEDYPQEAVLAWMRRAIELPGSRLALARDLGGTLTGYSLVVPIFQAAIRLLRAEESLSALVRAKWTEAELQAMPSDPALADDYVIVRTCVTDEATEATGSALFRDLFGLLAREGTYVVYAAFAERRALYESLGFEPLRTAEVHHWIADHPFQAYVLDLKRVGFEPWIEAVTSGRRPTPRRSADEVEGELSELFAAWEDDERLASSWLGTNGGGPAEVRDLVRTVLERVRALDDGDLALALRAVELAYIDRAASHERLAERLAVSRSTFYRLLRRGTRAVAEGLSSP